MMPLVGVALTIGVSAAAMGIDYTRAQALQQTLELAADAAALAAAARLPDADAARAAAMAYVEKNMPSNAFGQVLNPSDVEIGGWDQATHSFVPAGPTVPAAAVRVVTRLAASNGNALETYFGGVFGKDSVDIAASAIAGRTGAPCILALKPDDTTVEIKDDVSVEAIGCGVQINSTETKALKVEKNSTVNAAGICIGGTAEIKGIVSPEPSEYCIGQVDPLTSIEPPAYFGCDFNDTVFEETTETIPPGVYCGGIEIKENAHITLSSGVYIIEDGKLKVEKGGSLTGDEVMIYMSENSDDIEIKNESSFSATAPKSGPYTGVLIFRDRNSNKKVEWLSDSSGMLRGVIYLPNGKFTSSSLLNVDPQITPDQSCTVLIANEIELGDGSTVSIDLTSTDCRKNLPAPYSRGIVLLQ